MTVELKATVFLALKVIELVDALLDGFQLKDVAKIFAVITAGPTGLMDASKALQEYKAMTDAEALDLEQYIQASFNIPEDNIEKVIIDALDLLIKFRAILALKKVM